MSAFSHKCDAVDENGAPQSTEDGIVCCCQYTKLEAFLKAIHRMYRLMGNEAPEVVKDIQEILDDVSSRNVPEMQHTWFTLLKALNTKPKKGIDMMEILVKDAEAVISLKSAAISKAARKMSKIESKKPSKEHPAETSKKICEVAMTIRQDQLEVDKKVTQITCWKNALQWMTKPQVSNGDHKMEE